ncbi:MAG: mechanosensitive ion channel domain-containing protein [Acidimicrobiia bacterium]
MLAVKFFDIELVGINAGTGKKLLFTAALLAVVFTIRLVAVKATRHVMRTRPERSSFWSRQGIQLIALAAIVLGLISIWVSPGADITTGLGLISAGLAFALQQLITAFAGYFVILRGDTFNVGDRITLGGVRGDVIRLGFVKTTIMEMGQPPSVADTDPAVWVNSRQYTGRLVTVSNGKIFDEPVYNYTRGFPYLWEEIVIPITYDTDRDQVEQIMLSAAEHHAVPEVAPSRDALEQLQTVYALRSADLEPKVYVRITDNWCELSLRFVVPARGIRDIKDLMSRDILYELDDAGIGIASATYDIVGLPPIEIRPDQTEISR